MDTPSDRPTPKNLPTPATEPTSPTTPEAPTPTPNPPPDQATAPSLTAEPPADSPPSTSTLPATPTGPTTATIPPVAPTPLTDPAAEHPQPTTPPRFPHFPADPTLDAIHPGTYPPSYLYPAPTAQPPKPPGPPKSTAAAILLNLTGLGLGYAYLRRHLYFALALAGTATLITTAFLTDAANTPWPWRGLTAAWLALLALHAALLGRKHLPATSKRSVITAAAAVVAIAAGYVGYGIAGNTIYTDGIEAQKAGNCATALDRFGTVTGPFELTLSENVPDAAARTTECQAYASAFSAQKSGKHDTAIKQYTDFNKTYPHSVLHTFAYNNLAESHVNRATDWQLPLGTSDVIDFGDTLMMVLREFDDASAADRVSKAMSDLFEGASDPFTKGDFCGALPALNYFAGLDPAAMKDVITAANTNRAKALYECGLSQARAGDTDATVTLDTFLNAYPQDPGVPQAKSALIAAKVAQAAGVTLPVPPPVGDNSPGDIPVTFYNDSNNPLTILVAGPTAHEITLPPCTVCPSDYPAGAEPCPTFDGRPAARLELTPTTYYIFSPRESDIDGYTDSITPLVGYEHTQCIYVERR